MSRRFLVELGTEVDQKSIEVVKGGLVAKGIMIKELGDISDKIIICNPA